MLVYSAADSSRGLGVHRPLHLIHLFWLDFWCEIEALSLHNQALLNKLGSWGRMSGKDADELAESGYP